MAPLAHCLLLLSLAISSTALVTPHVARSIHHHHINIASSFVPMPVAIRQDPSAASASLHKRTPKRCKNRPPHHPKVPTPTPSKAPSNVGDSPADDGHPTPSPAPAHDPPASKPPAPKPPAPKPPAPKPPAPKPPAPKPDPPPPPPPQQSGPSFMRGTQVGQGTFYATGLGACGIVNHDTDHIAAVSHLLFDNFPGYQGGNPNHNPICGRRVQVDFEGKSVTVAITDRCEACHTTDLDFSPSAFGQIASFARGRIDGIKWHWI